MKKKTAKLTTMTTRQQTELEAYAKILTVLEPFPNATRLRIIKAAAILLGADTQP